MHLNNGERARVAVCREHIVDIAFAVFATHGTRAVEIDAVAAGAHVDEATVRQHFPTSDALVSAVLQRRDRLWESAALEMKSRLRATSPEDQLLAIFDVLHDGIQQLKDDKDPRRISGPSRMSGLHAAGAAAYPLDVLREAVRERAESAGLSEIGEFVACWDILFMGCIASAAEGDEQAARRSRKMAGALITQHRARGDR
ncbi:TetR/AcrR family transcriptional regulator [Mycobacterium sp. ML4]